MRQPLAQRVLFALASTGIMHASLSLRPSWLRWPGLVVTWPRIAPAWLILTWLVGPLAGAAEKVIFHPGWFPSAQFAGVFVAIDQGFYREAGLDVELGTFAYGQNAPTLIDATPDVCALGTIEGYILLQKRAQGADLKAMAAMLDESPAGFMTLDPAIGRVQDFRGKKIGVHKFADGLYRWFVQEAGLAADDAQMTFVGDDPALLVRGEVDVMQGYATEELVRLQQLAGGRGHFLSFASLGFASYSEILFTTAAQLDRHGTTLQRFVAATRRGWQYALAHPAAAVDAVAARQAAPVDREHLAQSLAAVGAFVSPGGQAPLAPMQAEKWRRLQTVGIAAGLLGRVEPVENFLVAW